MMLNAFLLQRGREEAAARPAGETALLRRALTPFPVSTSNSHIRPIPALDLQTGNRAQPKKPAESAQATASPDTYLKPPAAESHS